jgi:crotonobetainyl-CoA:carnitine CoA-transferase CaiB-like acyl-CoA transferase
VDMRHAATEFHSERWMRVDGAPPAESWDKVAGTYPCGDGRYVRLHTNFPHQRDGILRLLGCAHDREAVGAALRNWQAFALEDAAAASGLCVFAMRSFAEWDAHPQGRAVQAEPLIGFERIGDAPPRPLPPAARPLAGVRVLDLTRVIAGPVAGRTLAAHGADVLLITAPHLYNMPALVIDTGRGKRSAQLDLRDPAARDTLRGLLAEADVMVQGYRPGAIAARGFGPAEAAAARPGIVYVSLCAWGHSGPWRDRRGFDSLVQTASGLNAAEAEAAGQSAPKPLPVQALDHAAGNLLALGALAGLHRRHRGRQLARPHLPRPHRPLAARPRPRPQRPRLHAAEARGHRRIPGGERLRLRPPDNRPSRGAVIRDPGPLGPPERPAGHGCAALDLVPWTRRR